jgi:hypothetical protein
VTPLDPPATASLTLTNPSVTAIEYRTRYSHNGTYWHPDSGWAPYSGPINFDKPGQWILYYRWRSAVTGQWSEEVAAPFTVAGTPPPPTKLGLSLSPKSKKLKKGKSVTVKAKVTNTGDIPATNVKVCVTASAKSAKVNGNKCVTQATLAPGESWTAKFKIKKTGTHKNVKPKFKVTSPDAASKGGNVQLRRK